MRVREGGGLAMREKERSLFERAPRAQTQPIADSGARPTST